MNYFERAKELNEETIANRRFLHKNAETGLDLPVTKAFVMEKLTEYGLTPKDCGYGVTATLGTGGKVFMLRADMDALPMKEESNLPFASATGQAHTCGHDLHTAMLLTAARMLKENEPELEGTLKFMFQPAEETFQGSKNMIENGILENPPVDVALAYHVSTGKVPVGLYMYNNTGTMMFSVDGFKITVYGKGAHGAYPQLGIDPINIAVHIHLGLQELIARESDPTHACVLTIGHFESGAAANIIPDTALLEGTIRTDKPVSRELLVRRMKEVAERTAAVYGGTVKVEMISETPPLICNPAFTDEIIGYMKSLEIPNIFARPGISASASEDFAVIAEKVPGAFMYLGAGFTDERGNFGAHHPKAQFNEDVCPIGASWMAHAATQWLKNHK